ncbi:hypothetical protein ACR03S_06075 [Limimaricola variabilis]
MIRLVLLAFSMAHPAIAVAAEEPAKEEKAEPAAEIVGPYQLLPPEQINAFPPEILARMREALVALEGARDGG